MVIRFLFAVFLLLSSSAFGDSLLWRTVGFNPNFFGDTPLEVMEAYVDDHNSHVPLSWRYKVDPDYFIVAASDEFGPSDVRMRVLQQSVANGGDWISTGGHIRIVREGSECPDGAVPVNGVCPDPCPEKGTEKYFRLELLFVDGLDEVSAPNSISDENGCLWSRTGVMSCGADAPGHAVCAIGYASVGGAHGQPGSGPGLSDDSSTPPSRQEHGDIEEASSSDPPQVSSLPDGSEQTVDSKSVTRSGGESTRITSAGGGGAVVRHADESSSSYQVTTTKTVYVDGSKSVVVQETTTWENGDVTNVYITRDGSVSKNEVPGASGGGTRETVTSIGADGSESTTVTGSGDLAVGGGGGGGGGGSGDGEGPPGAGECSRPDCGAGSGSGESFDGGDGWSELEDVPGFGDALTGFWSDLSATPVFEAVSGMSASVPGGGTCYAPTFHLFDSNITMDAQCQLMDDYGGAISAVMYVIWILVAFMIFGMA